MSLVKMGKRRYVRFLKIERGAHARSEKDNSQSVRQSRLHTVHCHAGLCFHICAYVRFSFVRIRTIYLVPHSQRASSARDSTYPHCWLEPTVRGHMCEAVQSINTSALHGHETYQPREGGAGQSHTPTRTITLRINCSGDLMMGTPLMALSSVSC